MCDEDWASVIIVTRIEIIITNEGLSFFDVYIPAGLWEGVPVAGENQPTRGRGSRDCVELLPLPKEAARPGKTGRGPTRKPERC